MARRQLRPLFSAAHHTPRSKSTKLEQAAESYHIMTSIHITVPAEQTLKGKVAVITGASSLSCAVATFAS